MSTAGRPNPRYSRQAALDVIGPAGQEKLARSAVLIVGCGALGSTQAEYLARAGVGCLVLVDRDVPEIHNLQRQLLFDERDVRERLPKAAAAVRRLRQVNSEIAVEAVVADVTTANVEDLVAAADLVLDGTDNFATRYLINDAAVKTATPWIYGGVLETSGMVMPIRPGRGPCLRCLFEAPPQASRSLTCEARGVLSTVVAWVAALQATEALKLLVGDPAAEHRLHALDVWHARVSSVNVGRNPECTCCVHRRFEFLDSANGASAIVLHARNAVQITLEREVTMDFARLREKLAPLGTLSVGEAVLEFTGDGRRLVVFTDGRVLVMDTMDAAEARALVAKYIGS